MSRHNNRGQEQVELFRRTTTSPEWFDLDGEVREKVMRLLARLLGERWGRALGANVDGEVTHD